MEPELLTFERSQRQTTFLLKADLPLPNRQLQALRTRAERVLHTRLPQARELLSRLRMNGSLTALAPGTFHVVHHIARSRNPLVMRSTLDGLFVEDRSLLIEGWVARWVLSCAANGLNQLIPATYATGLRSAGMPFDFSILEYAPGIVVRDLGDDVLDQEQQYLSALGKVLRDIHQVHAEGAGPLDLTEFTQVPRGVHDSWPDYINLHLVDHIRSSAGAALIDSSIARRIEALFDEMVPSLTGRPMRLLHGDLGNHNICVEPRTRAVSSIIDWEDALVGDPLFDVATWLTFHPPRRHGLFLLGYGLKHPTNEERRLLALYYLRVALAKTVHRIRFGIADTPGRPPAHRRILYGIEMMERSDGVRKLTSE